MKILIILISLMGLVHADELHTKKEGVHQKHDDHGHEDKHEHNETESHSKHEDEEAGHHDDHDDHGHGGGKAIGEGKAILEVDEVKGFKLSGEAIKSLSIKFEKVSKTTQFVIAKSSLVTAKNESGIYRFRDGFFKFLTIKIIKEKAPGYLVEAHSLKVGDEIVTNGVGLLRVSDVYSTDKSEYGHAH